MAEDSGYRWYCFKWERSVWVKGWLLQVRPFWWGCKWIGGVQTLHVGPFLIGRQISGKLGEGD